MTKTRKTVYDVADACGVSIATISRVVNGHKNVNPETRKRIRKALQELGYTPSPAARALSMGQLRLISVWIGNLSSHYVMAFLAELEQHLADVDFEMILRNLWRLPEDEIIPPVATDGIVVLDEPERITQLKAAQPEIPLPIVSIGKFWNDTVDHVGLDLTEGTCEAVEHLISIGCTRVAYVCPKVRNNSRYPQYCAYHKTMEEAGRAAEIIETPRITIRPLVELAMAQYLAANPCPDGLVCHNDDHAIAVCRTLRRHGLRVPEDVAVVGCNGFAETEYLEHPLSTIVLPVTEACKAAWTILENRMRNPELPIQSVVLKPHLELRASSHR